MKNLRRLSVSTTLAVLVFLLFSSTVKLQAQFKYRSEELVVNVKGTSAVGDWQTKSNKGQIEAVFGLNANNKITGIYSLWFTVECESLKSGTAAMDKDAYKALKTSGSETVNFVLKSAKVKEIVNGIFELRCTGFLTIAGVEKETELLVTCIVNEDKSFSCSGTKDLKLSEFNIKLPSAVLNNIKPADDIAISYNLKIGRMQ
jgi:polyisoprenoid-binding protein YceI